MNRRAVLILLLCLAGHQALAGVEDLHRPILAVWTAESLPNGRSRCPACDHFWHDYKTNTRFRAALDDAYMVRPVNADARWLEAKPYGVQSIPAFIVPGGRVLHGYGEKDGVPGHVRLMRALGIDWLPVEDRPAGPQVTGPAAPSQSLPALPFPVGPKPTRPQITPDNQPLADSRQPAVGPAEAKPPAAEPEKPKPPADPSPAAGPQQEDASTSVVPQSGGNWITGVASTAAGILWGPAGAAAVPIVTGLIGWFAGRRKKRQQAKQPPGSVPITDSGIVPSVPATTAEPVPVEACPQCVGYRDRLALLNQRMAEEQRRYKEEFQRVERELQLASSPEAKATETRYVHVPVSDEAGEAYREAIRRVAELNPRAVSLLNQLESTAGQLLHGKKTKRGSAAPESKPGMWHDTED